MALQPMFPAQNDSPKTTLAAALTAGATSISLVSASGLPAAPGLLVLGIDVDAEVIKYTAISGNTLTGVTRGFGGTTAKAWPAGTIAARNFTAYDHEALMANITELDTTKAPKESPAFTGTPEAPTAEKGTSTNQLATTAFVAEGLADMAQTGSVSGAMVSVDDAANAPVANLTVAIEPVQSGEGDPSPTNVRAITGWDVCKVASTGKNLIDKFISNDFATGTVADDVFTSTPQTGTGYMNLCRLVLNHTVALKAGITYYYSLDIKLTSGTGTINTISLMDASNTAVARTSISIPTPTSSYQHFILKCTPTDDVTIAKIFVQSRQCTDAVFAVTNPMISIEPIDASTAYEPYQGQTVTIDLGGTRYGGTLDVPTGVLTVDREFVTLDGTESWSERAATSPAEGFHSYKGKPFTNPVQNTWSSNITSIASFSTHHTPQNWGYDAKGYSYDIDNSGYIYIGTDLASTVADWKTFLATANYQVCAKLVTPITVQLNPAEVRMLSGLCQVWADTGDCSLVYWRSAGAGAAESVENSARNAALANEQTRVMITDAIETAMTATRNFSAGDLLIVGSTLYKATQAIANGGAIKEGTNVTRITLAQYILDLLQ